MSQLFSGRQDSAERCRKDDSTLFKPSRAGELAVMTEKQMKIKFSRKQYNVDRSANNGFIFRDVVTPSIVVEHFETLADVVFGGVKKLRPIAGEKTWKAHVEAFMKELKNDGNHPHMVEFEAQFDKLEEVYRKLREYLDYPPNVSLFRYQEHFDGREPDLFYSCGAHSIPFFSVSAKRISSLRKELVQINIKSLVHIFETVNSLNFGKDYLDILRSEKEVHNLFRLTPGPRPDDELERVGKVLANSAKHNKKSLDTMEKALCVMQSLGTDAETDKADGIQILLEARVAADYIVPQTSLAKELMSRNTMAFEGAFLEVYSRMLEKLAFRVHMLITAVRDPMGTL